MTLLSPEHPQGERPSEVVLEHFDFEHEAFQPELMTENAEKLPDPVERWVEEMKTLVARQAGTIEVLISLDSPQLNPDRAADQYILERIARGDEPEGIQEDVQAVYEALEERIHTIKMPKPEEENP